MSDSEEEENTQCSMCLKDTEPEQLRNFKKGEVTKEDICSDCYKYLKGIHASKKTPKTPPPREPEQPVFSLSKKNLKRLSGVSRDVEECSDSGTSTISANFSKFYCCETYCKTKTGRFKHFRSLDAWLIHMMKQHKASLTYGDYLAMDHVMENFPHDEDDVIVSKFGNLGV